jgi:excisionase family DNA binding protein
MLLAPCHTDRMARTVLFPPGYTDRRGLQAYLGLSKRTIDKLLKHPFHPLPAYRPGEKLLFKLEEVDSWMKQFRIGMDLDHVVNDVLASLGKGKK